MAPGGCLTYKQNPKRQHISKMVEIRNEATTELEEIARVIRIQKLMGEPLGLEIDDAPLLDDVNTDYPMNCWAHLFTKIKKWFL